MIIRVDAELGGNVTIEALVEAAEQSASCDLYGLLKSVRTKIRDGTCVR